MELDKNQVTIPLCFIFTWLHVDSDMWIGHRNLYLLNLALFLIFYLHVIKLGANHLYGFRCRWSTHLQNILHNT